MAVSGFCLCGVTADVGYAAHYVCGLDVVEADHHSNPGFTISFGAFREYYFTNSAFAGNQTIAVIGVVSTVREAEKDCGERGGDGDSVSTCNT